MTGFAPDYPDAEIRVSPNFGPRPDGVRPSIILLHYTGMETGEGAEAWLCDPASEVSSHYLVHEDGRVVQMVREADRAWHAGRGSWQGVTDVNSHSIGIEIVNQGPLGGLPPFPDVQIEAVAALCRDIAGRHSIPADRVLAHSDTAPGRKVDPGPRFPWRRLHALGVGHIVAAGGESRHAPSACGDCGAHVETLQSLLQLYGYGVEITGTYDDITRSAVEAFQLHFRQALVNGTADVETLGLLDALVRTTRA